MTKAPKFLVSVAAKHYMENGGFSDQNGTYCISIDHSIACQSKKQAEEISEKKKAEGFHTTTYSKKELVESGFYSA